MKARPLNKPLQTADTVLRKEISYTDPNLRKFLYGANAEGWTDEYWKRIKEAKRNRRLAIARIYPDCQDKAHRELAEKRIAENPMGFDDAKLAALKKRYEIWQECELLLARTDDLNDEEKAMIMVNCRIVPTEEELKPYSVVLSHEWHRLTDFRHIDEVKQYYPAIYQQWADAGLLPNTSPTEKAWNEYFEPGFDFK